MKDTLSDIIKLLVDNPAGVSVEESDTDGMTQLTVTVDKADMGKVIGKEGKVIRALRNIMKIKAFRHDKKVAISLAEIATE